MPGVLRIQLGSQLQKQNRQPTSKKAAWQKRPSARQPSKTAARPKRPSDRQLLRQQLGRRELQTGNFSNSSLEEETFRKATSETAAWKTRPSAQQLQRKQLGKGTLPSQLGRQQLGNSAWNSPAFRQELRELSLSELERQLSTLSFQSLSTASDN